MEVHIRGTLCYVILVGRSKRQENWDLRKVDLLEGAALIFEDPEVIESIDPRNDDGEERIQALGQVDGAFYLVVYTWRGQTRHLITAWKVGEWQTTIPGDLRSTELNG
jgi:uncharacterized DUF497 family protein